MTQIFCAYAQTFEKRVYKHVLRREKYNDLNIRLTLKT